MKIAVLGTGGVGGYFGGRLAASGSDVTFVARGAHLEAIRKNGLRVISPRGDMHLQNANVVDDIAKVGAVFASTTKPIAAPIAKPSVGRCKLMLRSLRSITPREFVKQARLRTKYCTRSVAKPRHNDNTDQVAQ